MPRPRESGRERREKAEKFQSFNRPKLKIARTTESGKTYIDYKDTESLRKMLSGNGKIQSRKRTGATAMEQRMIARAVKRARYMALLPYAGGVAGGGGSGAVRREEGAALDARGVERRRGRGTIVAPVQEGRLTLSSRRDPVSLTPKSLPLPL